MIRKSLSYLFIAALLSNPIYFSTGCKQNNIIDEEKFIKIYTDIIFTADTASDNALAKDEIIKRILSNYNATLDEYKSTIQYYNQNSERWQQFFSKAITYLEEKRQKAAN